MTARDPLELTDRGNARRLANEHGDDLRFVPGWEWLFWDEKRWRIDPSVSGEAMRRAETIPDALLRDALRENDSARKAAYAKHALNSARRASLESMVRLAAHNKKLTRSTDDFDRDHFLFNVSNGTVDLRSGELREHRRDDCLTKLSPIRYDPTAKAPRFLEFLDEIMRGDRDMIAFLQRAVGYSLTGDTSEQCFFFLHGDGANGKGTLIRLLDRLLGEYFRQTDYSTFLSRHGHAVREDVADLAGARVVAAEEARGDNRLDEGLIKTLTGEDVISARFLHKARFTFRPTFKLWFAANEKPRISGVDHGMWRRVRLIPFLHKIETPDPQLEPYLHAEELSGILAWAVQGCLKWQRERLGVPAAVADATLRYRHDEDILADFFEDCCERSAERSALASDLYARYVGWASDQGMGPSDRLNQTRFGRALAARGFEKVRNGAGQVVRIGIALRSSASRTLRTVQELNHKLSHETLSRGKYVETVRNRSDCSHSARSYEDDERDGLQESA